MQQLGLFGDDSDVPRPKRSAIGPAIVPPDLAGIAARLPANVRLGTSSWSFPGWAGIVYDGPFSETQLARGGLAAYGRHPLLRTVGIDRTYYAPISADQYAEYAARVDAGFRFLVKAHELCTIPRFGARNRYHAAPGEPNDRFLDTAYAAEFVVAPAMAGLAEKLGPIVFQFAPLHLSHVGGGDALIDRLHEFLVRLPRGPLYAVEIRNAELLAPRYLAALRDAAAEHCFNVHPTMPPVAQQAALAGNSPRTAVVVRWMLGGDQAYEQARDRYAPFDKLVDEDEPNREAIAALTVEAVAAGVPVYTIANNKAEGSAPRTVFKLADAIVRRLKIDD